MLSLSVVAGRDGKGVLAAAVGGIVEEKDGGPMVELVSVPLPVGLNGGIGVAVVNWTARLGIWPLVVLL